MSGKTEGKKKTGLWITLAALALVLAVILAATLKKGDAAAPAEEEDESVSAAAGKMDGTPLGKEDEAAGASWYAVSGGNRLIVATFDNADSAEGYRWSVTVMDGDAIAAEEESSEAGKWSAAVRATGKKDTETDIYFDYKAGDGAEPKYIRRLKVRTDGKTLRVTEVEEIR